MPISVDDFKMDLASLSSHKVRDGSQTSCGSGGVVHRVCGVWCVVRVLLQGIDRPCAILPHTKPFGMPRLTHITEFVRLYPSRLFV